MKDATFSSARLLELYDRISDSEDAIPRLRRFVLDLAVRGKLVEQDASDEPAAELLKRIAKEKARLVQQEGIGKQAPFNSVLAEDQPFDIPSTWEWVPATYPSYSVSDLGKKIQTKDVLETGKYPVVDQGKVFIRGFCDDSDKVIKVQRPLIVFGDHTRETKLIDFDFVVGADGVKLLQPVCVDHGYYFLVLNWLPLESRGYGRHFKMLKASVVPLPPLAEQHRIVAKVDELMALCDQLDQARAGREAVRDRLTTASLARLTAPETDAETFQSHARFALQSLPTLTTRPDQIKTLRQTILDLAVRGKLVAQDAGDETAEDLLKQVQPHIKIKSDRSKSDEKDAIPHGWAWARIDELSDVGTGVTPSKSEPAYHNNGSVPWVNSAATNYPTIASVETFVTEQAVNECRLKIYPPGSLVVALYGQGKTRGQVAELRIAATVNQACAVIVFPEGFESLRSYIQLSLKKQYVEMRSLAEGGAQPNLNLGKIKSLELPIPPLAEQHRIVAKVDALMALCDQLEASLTTTATTRSKLLNALLHEALEPDVKAIEAAE